MSYEFTLSDIGLRLIKAYEGFYATPRLLTNGDEIVGFGHRMEAESPRTVTEDEAEELLKSDIEGYEELINTHVHTALTQSQFDALVSLASSIGEEAFLSSDIFQALNQGDIISAANGFDAWRLAEIEDEVYIVDALVRRRTAEKALFLRPSHRTVRAAKHQIKAQKDVSVVSEYLVRTKPKAEPNLTQLLASEAKKTELEIDQPRPVTLANPQAVLVDTEEVFDQVDETIESLDDTIEMVGDGVSPEESDLYSVVTVTPEGIHEKSFDRDETLTLNLQQDDDHDEVSPIAEAAAEVSERLDALMTDKRGETEAMSEDLKDNIVDFKLRDPDDVTIGSDDPLDVSAQEVQEFFHYEPETLEQDNFETSVKSTGRMAYVGMAILGLLMAGAGIMASLGGALFELGSYGPLLIFAAIFIGALLAIAGAYYLGKTFFNGHTNSGEYA